jgi:hypothetical protein
MISEAHIMKILKQYTETPEGKAFLKKKHGVELAESSEMKQKIKSYGIEMKKILLKYTREVIKSISEKDIIVGMPSQNKSGEMTIKISFRDGALRRESLDPTRYPEGLENIVLLFTRGYSAGNYVYGHWEGHDANVSYRKTRSKKQRNPNNFLKRAVVEFNLVMRGKASAKLEGEYKSQ